VSILRWSADSDVYVYESVNGGFRCVGCQLDAPWDSSTTEGVYWHLMFHAEVGDKIPERAVAELAYRRKSQGCS
jgi:hypothetical protein